MTRSRSLVAKLSLGAFALIAAVGLTLSSARAYAVFETIIDNGTPGHLWLGAHRATPLHAVMAPGDTMIWVVEASLSDADSGKLSVEMTGHGSLVEVGALTAEVAACTGAFDVSRMGRSVGAHVKDVPCEGQRSTVVEKTPLADLAQREQRFELLELRQGAPRQLLVEIALPQASSTVNLLEAAAHIGLGVHASGEDAATPTPAGPAVPAQPGLPMTRLPSTGADLVPLGVMAFGLIGVALTLFFGGFGAARTPARRQPAQPTSDQGEVTS